MTLNYDNVLFTSVKTHSNFDALYHGKGFQPPLLRSKHFRRTEERGFRYFACAENEARAKKRTVEVGEGKEGNACGQTPGF